MKKVVLVSFVVSLICFSVFSVSAAQRGVRTTSTEKFDLVERSINGESVVKIKMKDLNTKLIFSPGMGAKGASCSVICGQDILACVGRDREECVSTCICHDTEGSSFTDELEKIGY